MSKIVKVIAEIGINHNGNIELAKKLIDVASVAGCDYVKFQKRNPAVCVPEEQKSILKDTPWGRMTYLEYKYKTEFGKEEYDEIDRYCKERDISWFASVWDTDSVDFMKQYTQIMKIPSALITDDNLCMYTRQNCKTLLMSTGMSTEQEVLNIKKYNPNVVFHTNSAYPSLVNELNLNYIYHLRDIFPEPIDIGYSGHEYGLVTTIATVPMGATWIERHITLDRTMWGSDQSASIEPSGVIKLVKGIRELESALGIEGARVLLNSEQKKRKSLRG